jgi:hypothetical protein
VFKNQFISATTIPLMHRKLTVILTVLISASALVFAQSSGGAFEITKSTIDSGGGTSAGGDFSLTGTIGQPDSNAQISSGSEFLLAGGFWAKAIDTIFKNGFESD